MSDAILYRQLKGLAIRYGETLYKIPWSKRVKVGILCAHCAALKDSCRLPSNEGWRFGLEFAFPDIELLKCLDCLSFEAMAVVAKTVENQARLRRLKGEDEL